MGYASSEIKGLYQRNIFAFVIELLLSMVASILISGSLLLAFYNLFGKGYSVTLANILAAWLKNGILISLVIFIFLQILVAKFIKLFTNKFERDTDRNMDVSTEGVYGTGNLMSREEMEKTFVIDTLRNNKNTILGRDPKNENFIVGQKHPLMKINRNVLMIAGPSAGKSATFVIPLVMQIMRRGESACISDPKGELFKILGELGKKLGYEVRILNLNPMFLENSDPCNFLKYVGSDIDKAQVVSKAIITNTTDIFDFWAEGAENLLQFVMLYLNYGTTFKESQKNIPYIFTWLVENDLETIENVIDTLPDSHPAKAPGLIFSGGEPKVKAQTLQGLRIKLKLFNSPKLKKILSKTEGSLDILSPGRKKCLYFVGSNDQDTSMEPVVSLFYTLLYQELVRYADKRKDQQLPITVHMVLDEYANMCTIPDFEKKLSTVRSRNIVTYIILQDINQLCTKHPLDTWRTVINDCDYFLMLKTNDTNTMQWWNEMCGEMTINVKNARYSKSKMTFNDLHVHETITEGLGNRSVMTEHEIRTLKDDEVLVLVSQRNPVLLKTFFWKEHPYAKHVDEVLPTQHYPFWRLIEDGVVDKDFDYDKEPSIIMEVPEDEEIEIDHNYDPDKILSAFEKEQKKKNAIQTGRNTVDRFKNRVKVVAGKRGDKTEPLDVDKGGIRETDETEVISEQSQQQKKTADKQKAANSSIEHGSINKLEHNYDAGESKNPEHKQKPAVQHRLQQPGQYPKSRQANGIKQKKDDHEASNDPSLASLVPQNGAKTVRTQNNTQKAKKRPEMPNNNFFNEIDEDNKSKIPKNDPEIQQMKIEQNTAEKDKWQQSASDFFQDFSGNTDPSFFWEDL